MSNYLFIESRDAYESSDVAYFSDLVRELARRGGDTTVFFVQNGVLAARPGAKANEQIKRLVDARVAVLADGFALRERAIARPMDGVEAADMNRLVALLLEPGTKAIWH